MQRMFTGCDIADEERLTGIQPVHILPRRLELAISPCFHVA
jgi:hypothetical protein